MRILAPLAVLLLLLAPRGPLLRAGADESIDPAVLFRDRCATCHAVPDPGLPMDRAWVDQVHRTT